jgi:alginate biosynthesis protein AlgX
MTLFEIKAYSSKAYCWLAQVIVLSFVCCALANASNIPAVKITLCDTADRPESYRGKFLKNFKTLQKGERDWLYRDMDLKRTYGPRQPGYKNLQQLQQALQARGTALVMVPIPGRALIHPEYLGEIDYDVPRARKSYINYLQKLRDTGIAVPKIDSLFEQTQSKPMFFARDHHWNHHGARTIARLTAYAIKAEKKLYSGIEKQKFESFAVGSDHNQGSLQRAALELCEQRYPKEPFKLYQTVAKGSDDLFGDLPEPQIVLVGTSNSKSSLNFNFDGFLAHYIGAAVINKAKSGSGFGGALKDYLNSDDFRQSPPRFLVWEVPGYYSLNDQAFFDQILMNLRGDGGQS